MFHVKPFCTIAREYRTVKIASGGRPAAEVITAKLGHWPEIKLYYTGVLRRPAALRMKLFQKDN
jgi:hypothetical protein